MSSVLTIWTIYDRPTDWPDWYVARAHDVTPHGTGQAHHIIMRRDLENLRLEMRAMGLTCLGRQAGDEPQIVESWV